MGEISRRSEGEGTAAPLKAPFPYFGGKSLAAPIIWRALGDVPNYVEPFFGSGACLLARPHAPRIETANDASGFVANFWRALQADPEGLAEAVDNPVHECDMHARNAWLNAQRHTLQSALEGDPAFYDLRAAAYWVAGMCEWIGNNYLAGTGPWVSAEDSGGVRRLVKLPKHPDGFRKGLPHLGGAGKGIHRQLPHFGDAGTGIHRQVCVLAWFAALAERLRRVRFACGDWSRVVTPSVTTKHGLTGIFLDPPYPSADTVYDRDTTGVAEAVVDWAFAHGHDPLLRIALTVPEGPLAPEGWRVVPCPNRPGYARKSQARKLERIFLSPHCLEVAEAS